MKQIALLLGLGGITASAQTVVGLPQYGINLSESPNGVQVVNNSGKTIVGFVFRTEDASGKITLAYQHWLTAMPIASDGVGHTISSVNVNGTKDDNLYVDSAVFADGSVVGVYKTPLFADLQKSVAYKVAAAKVLTKDNLSESAWSTLAQMMPKPEEDGGPDKAMRKDAIQGLLIIRDRFGDAKAQALAEQYLALDGLHKQ